MKPSSLPAKRSRRIARLRHFIVPVALLIVPLSSVLFPMWTAAADPGPADCSDIGRAHPPIEINEDVGPNGFVLAYDLTSGKPIPRPGSGVVGGTGTAADPYLITGWCVPGARYAALGQWQGSQAGIAVRDTTSHVIIRGNTISGPGPVPSPLGTPGPFYLQSHVSAVLVAGASNVSIKENVARFGYHTIDVNRASDIAIQGNRLSYSHIGMLVADSVGVNITGNALVPDPQWGIGTGVGIRLQNTTAAAVEHNVLSEIYNDALSIIAGTSGVHVRNNTIQSAWRGVFIDDSKEVIIDGNSAADVKWGIRADHSSGVAIENNTVGGTDRGITIRNGERVRIINTSVVGSRGEGIFVTETNQLVIRDNEIRGNGGHGLAAEYGRGLTLRGNTFQDNGGIGVRLQSLHDSTVEQNMVRGHGTGVYPIASENLLLSGNEMGGNQVALDARWSGWTVDARFNWWGCPEGPHHEACAALLGPAMYDPWLIEPNLD